MDEFDPLTAPIEQVIGSAPEPLPLAGPGDALVAPATPPEFQIAPASYGSSGGPAPVPPIEEAANPDRPQSPVRLGSRCECGKWETVNPGTGEVEEATGCEEVTRNKNSRFAPGHDARFKGLLIRAGIRDHRIRERGTDKLSRPTTVAGRISAPLMRRVEEGIRRGKR